MGSKLSIICEFLIVSRSKYTYSNIVVLPEKQIVSSHLRLKQIIYVIITTLMIVYNYILFPFYQVILGTFFSFNAYNNPLKWELFYPHFKNQIMESEIWQTQ